MSGFLDLFGLRRRRELRVRVNWLVDARLRDSQHYVGFHAADVSLFGVRLRASSAGDFERVIDRDRVYLLLRVPGSAGAAEVETEVKWRRVEQGQALLGCEFKRLDRELRRALEEYIAAHPQDQLAEE
jgi:hypothetical protein